MSGADKKKRKLQKISMCSNSDEFCLYKEGPCQFELSNFFKKYMLHDKTTVPPQDMMQTSGIADVTWCFDLSHQVRPAADRPKPREGRGIRDRSCRANVGKDCRR